MKSYCHHLWIPTVSQYCDPDSAAAVAPSCIRPNFRLAYDIFHFSRRLY